MKHLEQEPETELPQSSAIEIIYAGGTISSLMTAEGYRVGGHKMDLVELMNINFPHLLDGITIPNAQFAYLGLSENMHYHYWEKILDAVAVALVRQPRAIVVTHGTDSLEQTARFLASQLQDRLSKARCSIIITAANRDISDPNTDAWDNLRFSFESAAAEIKPGVYVAFHEQLIPAEEVVKEPFDGKEMNYTSVHSLRHTLLQERQRQVEQKAITLLQEYMPVEPDGASIIEYPVNVIIPHHQEFLAQLEPHTKAVLLTLYHSGTANTEDPTCSVANLVATLRENGIVVFGVTENGEPVDLHLYDTSVKLRQAGVVPLYNMSKGIAKEKLRYAVHYPPRQMIEMMLSNLVGEITEDIYFDDIRELLSLYQSEKKVRIDE